MFTPCPEPDDAMLGLIHQRLAPPRRTRATRAERRRAAISSSSTAAASGGALYSLGIFGALVYFWQQADAFWEYILAVIQGLFWPAWMVYHVFEVLRA